MKRKGAKLDLDDAGELVKVGARIAGAGDRFTQAILDTLASVPHSDVPKSSAPHVRALALSRSASRTAAAISGSAALVPGPLGLATLVLDLRGVWKTQAQMVADIAALYGKTSTLTTEQMVFCLFKHTAAHLLRDVVVRAGERYVVRRAGTKALAHIATRLGVTLANQALGKTVARYVPLAGALTVAGYAYWDTRSVAQTAIELFSHEVVVIEGEELPGFSVREAPDQRRAGY